jgi:hypothetical protein
MLSGECYDEDGGDDGDFDNEYNYQNDGDFDYY